MMKRTTGTRNEWLTARLELLESGKELTRRSDALVQRRQALPWVRIDKANRFETDEGVASLTGRRWRGVATRLVPRTPLRLLLWQSNDNPPGYRDHGSARDGRRGGGD